MLKVDSVKTKLVLNAKSWLVYLAIIFAIAGGVYGLWLRRNSTDMLRINGHTYGLTVARTVAAQEKGLGGRSSMSTNQGMLFAFNGQAVRCFWMKDMHFPLDMIWLNSQKQTVYVLQDVAPTTYPDSFCPPELAKYVIELNAGQVRKAGIKLGQTVEL